MVGATYSCYHSQKFAPFVPTNAFQEIKKNKVLISLISKKLLQIDKNNNSVEKIDKSHKQASLVISDHFNNYSLSSYCMPSTVQDIGGA